MLETSTLFSIFRPRATQSATDCALLVAIPLNRAEFDTAWQRRTDFLEVYAAASGVSDRDRLWTDYERYAGFFAAAVGEVATYGVTVFRNATLDAFADAVRRWATVTIVAHSREPAIETRDIAAFETLRGEVRQIAAALDVAPPAHRLGEPARLATWLDTALGPRDNAAGEPNIRTAAWRAHRQKQRWLRRQMIEQRYPGALRGGPALELDDGLWTLPQIDMALPVGIQTLDLTVCDSVLLADVLRARRTTGVILANAQPTTPDFRLVLYRETVRLMSRHGLSYHEAALSLRRTLNRRPSTSREDRLPHSLE